MIPSSQRVLAQQTATIECFKLNGPCPNWSWKGPTINIRPRRYTLTTMRANATSILTINRLTEQDEGTYYCVCNGVRSGPSQVQVIRKYLSNRRIWFSACACNWLQQGNGRGGGGGGKKKLLLVPLPELPDKHKLLHKLSIAAGVNGLGVGVKDAEV